MTEKIKRREEQDKKARRVYVSYMYIEKIVREKERGKRRAEKD